MEEFLQEIEKALEYKLYFIALQSTLTLPDICGALSSQNGEATKSKYITWFNNYAKQSDSELDGLTCYLLRCSNLHQGIATHKNSKFRNFLFVEPHPNFTFSNCTYNNCYLENLDIFCTNMISSVRSWLPTVQESQLFQTNYKKLLKRYPDLKGFSNIPTPYIG